MSNLSDRKRMYREAAAQTRDWMLSHQREDGFFGPIERMSHCMLAGTALLEMGRPEEAGRLMAAVKRMFVRPEGGFDPPEVRAGVEGALRERGYAPSWMIYSAHANLAFDISLRNVSWLLRLQDPATGGMFASMEEAGRGKGIIHTAVTSVASEAAIATGRLAEARRLGDHLTDRVIGCNPDLSTALYPVWDTETGLRTGRDAPSFPNMPPVIRRDLPDQHHYLTGMMIGALVDLHFATGERKYLDGALTVYEFVSGAGDAACHSTASHKLAWGCAWLYRATGNAAHLETACRVCDYLVSIQEPDGTFVHRAFVKRSEDWPYSPRFNISGQFALWITRTMHLL